MVNGFGHLNCNPQLWRKPKVVGQVVMDRSYDPLNGFGMGLKPIGVTTLKVPSGTEDLAHIIERHGRSMGTQVAAYQVVATDGRVRTVGLYAHSQIN